MKLFNTKQRKKIQAKIYKHFFFRQLCDKQITDMILQAVVQPPHVLVKVYSYCAF